MSTSSLIAIALTFDPVALVASIALAFVLVTATAAVLLTVPVMAMRELRHARRIGSTDRRYRNR